MFQLLEAETVLSFTIMKREMPDNLINMCCIPFSALTLFGRKRQAFVWGFLAHRKWLQCDSEEHSSLGRRGVRVWGGGLLEDVSLFDQGLLTDHSEKGKWGSYHGPMTRGPILMSLFSHCGASLSSQNLPEQPGKMAFLPTLIVTQLTGQLS